VSALPASVREDIEAGVRPGRRIVSAEPVAGGCINHGARVRWDDGRTDFLKWNRRAPVGMFQAEADGLTALRRSVEECGAALAVPEVLGFGGVREGTWLLCTWIGRGPGGAAVDERLGEGLATLHDAPATSSFGWHRGNWIGSLAQTNDPDDDWAAFWNDRRIGPQLELARSAGRCGQRVYDRFREVLPDALGGTGPPSLLHGDLWSGNAYAGEDGTPVLVDPAVYRGHAEVDLSMTELFGGFGPSFYDAYDAVRPLGEAYVSHRRDAYQLYYLLVHVNLFGTSYEPGARAAAARVVSVLR
jgi:fructosamine-3-kinase